MRVQKNRILVNEATGDAAKLQTAQIRLHMLDGEYNRFSKVAGLRRMDERIEVVGFGPKQAREASAAASGYHKMWLKSIGAENSGLNTLEKYVEEKYNSSPEFELLKQYAKDVDKGWISPLCGFDNYKELHGKIQAEIVGKTAVNGTVITGQVPHFMQRVVGTSVDPEKLKKDLRIIRRSGVKIEDIENAIFNPVSVGQRTIKENGKASVRFTGARCIVSINPDTGMLIQTNPRKE